MNLPLCLPENHLYHKNTLLSPLGDKFRMSRQAAQLSFIHSWNNYHNVPLCNIGVSLIFFG
jgi:hypothetical protein